MAHYGEKVYKCTLCNGTFNSKKALETHIKTHSEDHVPIGAGSPHHGTDHHGIMSPSSRMSHAAPPSQNSDKENRECSDSELSSQNSPSSHDGGPKTPPSPVLPYSSSAGGSQNHSHHPGGFKTSSSSANNNSNNSSSNSNNNSSNSQDKTSALPIPYPMLPPGVQIQQAPHSRTTFLYVTSKLPNHSSSSSTSSISPPPQSPPLVRQPSHVSPNGFIGHSNNAKQQQQAVQQQFVAELKGAASDHGRNKLLMHKIREKVLQFTERFGGYGLTEDLSQETYKQQLDAQKRFVEENNSRYSSGGVSVHPIMAPENLTFNNNNGSSSKGFSEDMYHKNRLMQMKREGSSSPEQIQSSYTPGGVLALALTKGSKAAAAVTNSNSSSPHHHHNIPAKVSLIPVTSSSSSGLFSGYHSHLQQQQQQLNRLSPRSSSPGSPVDFHHQMQLSQHQQLQHSQQFYMRNGPGSVSPTRNSLHSPSPNSTPRSTPSLQEDYSDPDTHISSKTLSGDLSGDENSSSSSSSMAGSKRARSPNSSGGGPRKRSSLILEKYAMENPATPASATTPPPSNGSESILSQRLRLSSVIQYAEKCS